MSLAYEIRRRARAAVAPTLLVCTVGYFAYYAIHGERGLFGYLRIVDRIGQVETALDARTRERDRLALRVRLLRRDALDTDILDERARGVLGLAHPDEVVIYRGE